MIKVNKKNYCNFYNDNFNFRKIENISFSQQTDITNNIIETNTQTINYVDSNLLLLTQHHHLLKSFYGFLKEKQIM